MRKLFGFVLLLALALPAFGGDAWYEQYERGLQLIQAGDADGALTALQGALAESPEPRLRAPTTGPRYVDYLPYLYLAVASHMAGDAATANEYLEQSEAAGAATLSEVGAPLLESYRGLLGRSAEVEEPASYREYEPQPVVLTEEEFRKTQKLVATRCGLAARNDLKNAPWYFHYELALELTKQGDPQRALDSMIVATEDRPDPQRSARMYGMWFIDYLPYYEIARIHAELGNWECARDALRLSEAKGEITQDHEQFDEFWTLREEVTARADQM